MVNWAFEYEQLVERVAAYGVAVRTESLGDGVPGVFDGVSISTNPAWDIETRSYVLAHCFGHTVQWGLDFAHHEILYRELSSARANRTREPGPLERVLKQFRRYEEEASEYGTWLFADSPEAMVTFANFARADIEAIITIHRDGSAPPWREFFAGWNEEVRNGTREIVLFQPRPAPPFQPVAVPKREVIQM